MDTENECNQVNSLRSLQGEQSSTRLRAGLSTDAGKSKCGESQLEHWGKCFRRKKSIIGIFSPAQGIVVALYKGDKWWVSRRKSKAESSRAVTPFKGQE